MPLRPLSRVEANPDGILASTGEVGSEALIVYIIDGWCLQWQRLFLGDDGVPAWKGTRRGEINRIKKSNPTMRWEERVHHDDDHPLGTRYEWPQCNPEHLRH